MSRPERLSGVITPILTPFDKDGEPDAHRFTEHAKWVLKDGATGLAPFGTTGEATSLGLIERMRLLETLIHDGIAPHLLVPGTGMCALSDTALLCRHAVETGCGGVMMLPPFYYKAVTDEGLFRYTAEVIEHVRDNRLRIYLYHIPPIAQIGWSIELVGRLIDEFPETVVGVKDSSGDWQHTARLMETYPGLTVLPGSEEFLLAGLRAGGAGCITATGNVNARAIRTLYDNWQSEDADTMQAALTATRATIEERPLIPMLKAIVAHFRRDPGWNRMPPPFLPIEEAEVQATITKLADQHGFALEAA